ncbi:unnamed protein product [Miscanthus lutarioriparius]|uniref:Uncharacterized protein n=1 Tax=Miscanthus lutarioriparius TaxID=422564 RepID=A0A811Q270_9POAL|nr:unnamed protein product [Miscanthus lutarioriparius]
MPAAGLRVRGCPPLWLLSGRAECRLHDATARFLSESSAQLLAGPAMRIDVGRFFLFEGIAEEPLAASSPWSARLLRFSSGSQAFTVTHGWLGYISTPTGSKSKLS